MRRFLIVSVLLLAGCVSPEQAQWEKDQREIRECQRLGISTRSSAFAQCRLQLRMIEAQQDQADAARDAARAMRSASTPKRCKKTHSGNTICKTIY